MRMKRERFLPSYIKYSLFSFFIVFLIFGTSVFGDDHSQHETKKAFSPRLSAAALERNVRPPKREHSTTFVMPNSEDHKDRKKKERFRL